MRRKLQVQKKPRFMCKISHFSLTPCRTQIKTCVHDTGPHDPTSSFVSRMTGHVCASARTRFLPSSLSSILSALRMGAILSIARPEMGPHIADFRSVRVQMRPPTSIPTVVDVFLKRYLSLSHSILLLWKLGHVLFFFCRPPGVHYYRKRRNT